MRNKIIFQVAMCVVALLSFVLPVSAQQSDETSEYEVANESYRCFEFY